MEHIVELEFKNKDAIPQNVQFLVSETAVVNICRWYNGFFEGDDYQAFVDGDPLNLDMYGEIIQ